MYKNYIARGILIGGSMGALAVIFKLMDVPMFIGIGMGMIAGCLAGVTRLIINRLRNKQD